MALAASEPEVRGTDRQPMTTHTFRIHEDLEKQAMEKCAQHGVSLGKFLRKCCETLLSEYQA
jgi:hypothetical protein